VAVLLASIAALVTSSISYAGSGDSAKSSPATPNVASGETLKGKATYYPNSLNGHKTSSGEMFHQSGNTAASNKLPLGTHVKVTNLETGKSTDVKVTDRGPKLGSQKIDLSKKAAHDIGLTRRKGKVPVRMKVTDTATTP
jgi:rare lipoprotein A